MAGGIIAVLGLSRPAEISGYFTGTGMHGGRMYLRTDKLPDGLPKQVHAAQAVAEDLKILEPYLNEYCGLFSLNAAAILKESFYLLTPDSQNPYKQLYVNN
jgi:glutamate synthase domain-containing protein 3